ncbi:MAG: DUF1349 domain-containing protein [Planctomycetes bacterium]|nr:DUF1349 domain-containing protein [Planctomycetota bacterium]
MKLFLLLALAIAPPVQEAKTAADKVLFEEKFAGELSKEWAWVREDAKAWRIDKDKGTLVLRNLPGYLHAGYNNSRNILLRPMPKSNKAIAIEVHVEAEPKVQYEHAGVVWYVDDDNYVSLFQEVLKGEVELQMVSEKAGKGTFHVAKHSAKGVWLRLVIDGVKATTHFKPADDAAWKTVGQSALPSMKEGRIGVMAGGAPKDADRYVRFRGFRIVELGK